MLAWRLGHVSLVFLLPSAIITLFVLPFFCNRCARSIAFILCMAWFYCHFILYFLLRLRWSITRVTWTLHRTRWNILDQSEWQKSWTFTNQAERKKKTNFVGKKMRMGKGKGGGDESSDENDWWKRTLCRIIWGFLVTVESPQWSMLRDLTISDYSPCWWAILIVVLHCTVIALSFLNILNPWTRCFKSEYSQMEPELL